VKRSRPGSLGFEGVVGRDAQVGDGAAESAVPSPDPTGGALRGAFSAGLLSAWPRAFGLAGSLSAGLVRSLWARCRLASCVTAGMLSAWRHAGMLSAGLVRHAGMLSDSGAWPEGQAWCERQ